MRVEIFLRVDLSTGIATERSHMRHRSLADASGSLDGTNDFTIPELLVSLSVMSMLMALLLPAIHDARATARRVQCLNHLRQLGLAAASFEGAYGYLPGGCGSPTPYDSAISPGALSAHAMLLLFVEQSHLYEKLDLQESGLGWYPYPKNGDRRNETLPSVSIFQCPDDAVSSAGTSYRFCVGKGKILNAGGAMSCICGMSEQGLRRIYRPSYGAIVDGLSNTAFAAESLHGDMKDGVFTKRRDSLDLVDPWLLVTAFVTTNPELAMATCQSASSAADTNSPNVSNAGATWLLSGNAYTWYSHVLPPNSGISDCTASGFKMNVAVVTTRSLHKVGVNVAMADGSVQFTSNAIDLAVWRKLGDCSDEN